MRILILNWKDLSHPKAGGAEVYTEQVARHWVRAGHEVTLFCASVAGRPADELVEGVRVARRGGRFGVYRAARRWYAEHGRGRFDVVIDEVNTRPFLTPRWLTDTPVVALIHQVCKEIWSYEMPWPVSMIGRYWLEPRWLRLYRDVPTLTVSQSSLESLQEYGLRNLTIVPEGVGDLVRPDVAKEEQPTVLFVGRLAGNKRPGDALEAFRLLGETLPEAKMWFVGEGPERARLEARAVPGVTFFGRVSGDRKHELMARAHVLVVTSVREGWGLVVDEAASMGTPTVAYDVPGLRDAVPRAGGQLIVPLVPVLVRALAATLAESSLRPVPGAAVPWAHVATGLMGELTRHQPGPAAGPSPLRPDIGLWGDGLTHARTPAGQRQSRHPLAAAPYASLASEPQGKRPGLRDRDGRNLGR